MNRILYPSHFELFRQLSAEQVYQIINKIGDKDYSLSDPICIGIWMSMERDFLVQEENYNKVVERNRTNGMTGGRPKKTQQNPNNPMGFLETQETQVNPENLKDKDKDKDKGRDKDKDKLNTSSSTSSSAISEKNSEEEIDSLLDSIIEVKNISIAQLKNSRKRIPR